ncbi:hypothetical protein CPB86DRAFT_130229 [Serendipita vermifera]|nr:hypothetical protein CPB86DRAFT_130229 [Serendipita vermifera]
MDLDGFVVESADNGAKKPADEQAKNTSNVLAPIPVVMPEPQVLQPGSLDASNSNVPNQDSSIKMPEPNYGHDTSQPTEIASQPHAGNGGINVPHTSKLINSEFIQEEKQEVTNEKQEKRSSRRESNASSSSSSSASSKADSKKEKTAEDIDFNVDGTEVISHDPVLSRNVKILSEFLNEHGSLKPDLYVRMTGTHTERRTRTVVRNGKTVTESYTVTVTDFTFSIDLSKHVSSKPTFYTVADNVPAFRGGMRMAVEKGGPCQIERRQLVTHDEQGIREDQMEEDLKNGQAPWISRPLAGAENAEAQAGIGPMASGRSFEDWLQDYIQSRRVVKDFKLRKVIHGWNTASLEKALIAVIRDAGYKHSIDVHFSTSMTCIHVRSPNFVSKIFSSCWLKILFSVILVFPFLWLWRRFWPGAGGKWGVAGVAFPIKKTWELVPGTSAGETLEQARQRLGDDVIPPIKKTKVTPEGVWIMKGTHEAEWLRKWQDTIRYHVVHGDRVDWITLRHERNDAMDIAAELDHLP